MRVTVFFARSLRRLCWAHRLSARCALRGLRSALRKKRGTGVRSSFETAGITSGSDLRAELFAGVENDALMPRVHRLDKDCTAIFGAPYDFLQEYTTLLLFLYSTTLIMAIIYLMQAEKAFAAEPANLLMSYA